MWIQGLNGWTRLFSPKLLELKTLQEKISFTEQALLKRLSDVRENTVVNDTIQNILNK